MDPLLLALITGVIGLATVAVLVSQNAQTGSVLTSGGTGFASIITAAVAPVAGSAFGSAATGALGSLL